MKYIIKIFPDCDTRHVVWYRGTDFTFAREKYACYEDFDKAHRYSSRKVAERVANRIYEQCSNVWKTEIEEVTE